MKKLFLKLFFALLPVLLIIALYFINDPFKVLYRYSTYFPADGIQYVGLNNDYTATETFLNQYQKYNYNSYIFGSSRSMLFHIDEWQKHVPGGSYFHFAASNESLYGMERKLHLIDSLGLDIKNVLMVFDPPLYSVTNENPAFPKDPVLSGKSKLNFEINSAKGFFDAHFLTAYIRLLFTHKVKSSVWDHTLSTDTIHYNFVTNDISYPKLDEKINADTGAFYGTRKDIFYPRGAVQLYTQHIIKDSQVILMQKIKKIFDKHKTSYKIVLSPLYDQLKIDSTDINILYAIFGKDSIYDYSGINDITSSKYNYYENAHFRTFIAKRIMDSIYIKR